MNTALLIILVLVAGYIFSIGLDYYKNSTSAFFDDEEDLEIEELEDNEEELNTEKLEEELKGKQYKCILKTNNVIELLTISSIT